MANDDLTYRTSVDISAPAQIVWEVMSDAERWHEWTPSVTSIRVLDKPLRVGSRALIRQPKFPPAMWKVTSIEPGRGFIWKSGMPLMWVFGHHFVEPIPGGTRATLQLYYKGPIGRLLARMTRDITNKYLGYEAAGLKQRSEQLAGRGR